MKKTLYSIIIISIFMVSSHSCAANGRVSLTPQTTTLQNNGDSQTITISLDNPIIAPSESGVGQVTLRFSPSDPRVTVSPKKVIFLQNEWSQQKTITLTKVGNAVEGGPNTVTVRMTTTSNSEYYNLFQNNISVTLSGPVDSAPVPTGSQSGRRIPQATVWWNQNDDKKPNVELLTKPLSLGVYDYEVQLLQRFLNTHNAAVVATGIGSRGNEGYFFGTRTRDALRVYQQNHGLVDDGIAGPMTRKSINESLSSNN
ncbi:MAG: peptidoglycan-binding domain-containing protein [bacterium]